MAQVLQGVEELQQYNNRSQVYQVTHGEGGKRLPMMYRSFISFSFGNRLIEDYNFIAYTENNSIDRPSFSNFENLTDTYDVVDGQLYWGTHFVENELSLSLVTDGITERQLDDFKHWFCPGVARELVLTEHPNRAIIARLAEPPEFSFLPFEKKEKIKIAGLEKEASVTEYKGTVKIKFIADEPFWYARYNLFMPYMYGEGIFGIIPMNADINYIIELTENNLLKTYLNIEYKSEDQIKTEVFCVNNITVDNEYCRFSLKRDNGSNLILRYPIDIVSIQGGAIILNEEDYIKVMIEDNIPHISMIKQSCILGDNLSIQENDGGDSRIFNDKNYIVNSMKPYTGAHINSSWIEFNNAPINTSISLKNGSKSYLYYPGTAPSRPILKFTFTPHLDNNNKYIKEPYNKTYSSFSEYNYLAINDNKFYFTTPALLTGYNQAVSIVENFKQNESYPDLITAITEGVHEYYSRAWAIGCLQALKSDTSYVSNTGAINNINNFKAQFLRRMKYFICKAGNLPNDVTVEFNCKTGETTGTFKIRVIDNNSSININTDFSKFSLITVVENIGDMVKSDYLVIEGRDYPNLDGFITNSECHSITTNYSSGLYDLSIIYKVLYY